MNITSFYPALLTKNANVVVEKMKKLGFEVVHETKDLIQNVDHEFTLQDANGNRFDVVHTDVFEDKYAIRANVDNIEEAVSIFKEIGFNMIVNIEANASSKRALVESPEGQIVYLIEHTK